MSEKDRTARGHVSKRHWMAAPPHRLIGGGAISSRMAMEEIIKKSERLMINGQAYPRPRPRPVRSGKYAESLRYRPAPKVPGTSLITPRGLFNNLFVARVSPLETAREAARNKREQTLVLAGLGRSSISAQQECEPISGEHQSDAVIEQAIVVSESDPLINHNID
jgi:hypothetical protein